MHTGEKHPIIVKLAASNKTKPDSQVNLGVHEQPQHQTKIITPQTPNPQPTSNIKTPSQKNINVADLYIRMLESLRKGLDLLETEIQFVHNLDNTIKTHDIELKLEIVESKTKIYNPVITQITFKNLPGNFTEEIQSYSDKTIIINKTEADGNPNINSIVFNLNSWHGFLFHLQVGVKEMIERIGQTPATKPVSKNTLIHLWQSLTGKEKLILATIEKEQAMKKELQLKQETLKNFLPIWSFISNLNKFSNTKLFSSTIDLTNLETIKKAFTEGQDFVIIDFKDSLLAFEKFYLNEKSRLVPASINSEDSEKNIGGQIYLG